VRTWIWTMALLAVPAFMAGCPSGDDDDATPADDDTGDDDTGDDDWEVEQVLDADVGIQSRLVVSSSGDVWVGTWGNSPYEDGICDEIEVDPPPRMRQDLMLYERPVAGGTWVEDQIDAPVIAFSPQGFDLQEDPQGRPAAAYNGGEPQMQFCGSTDAYMATCEGGASTTETAGAESGDSNTGLPASDAGFVVGAWPALAFDGDGNPALTYKDTHFGTMQHDDQYRADLEYAFGGGGWTHEAPDPGEGAGDYGSLQFDQQGRAVAFYAISIDAQGESRHGVWAARREKDGEWTRVKLHVGAIYQEVVSAVHPSTGDLVAAWYSAQEKAVRVRTLSDPEQFADAGAWTDELVVSNQYDEGRYVSLAFTPANGLVLAYHRCKLLSDTGGGCNPNDEAVILAQDMGTHWQMEVVHEADVGSCGEYVSLDIAPDGTAFVAFRCTILEDDVYKFRLFVASKDIL